MDYLINQCIFPIMDGIDDVGQGFLADGYFITAAHVVKQHPNCFINTGGNIIKLSEIPLVLIGEGDIDRDAGQVDVAIYRYSYASTLLAGAQEGIFSHYLFAYFTSDETAE